MYPLQATLSFTVEKVFMWTQSKCVTLRWTVLMDKMRPLVVSIVSFMHNQKTLGPDLNSHLDALRFL